MANTKRKVGRPATISWGQFNLLWKNLSNSEIAERAGCTVVNVFLRRKRLIASAKKEGRDPSNYICNRPMWARKRERVEA